jgi:DNA-binding CsgD family transcriptional regulator
MQIPKESDIGRAGTATATAVGLDPGWLSDTIGTVYDCVLDPRGWHTVIGTIADRFSFKSAALGVLKFGQFSHELKVQYRFDDEWIATGDSYMEDSVRLWGGAERIQNFPLDEPIVASVVRPVAEWDQFAYWREMLKPRGMIDAVVIGLAREQGLVGYLALNRHATNGPIRPNDVEGLRLVAPHLRRAITISNLFDLKVVESATFRSVLDTLSPAVMLVDADLRIVHANPAAETMLAAGDFIQPVQGRLSVADQMAGDALRAAVTLAEVDEAKLTQRGIGIPATTNGGLHSVMHVLPLTRGDGRRRLAKGAVAAVFAVAGGGAHTTIDAIATLYDLTPAESQIFASLCRGVSLATTADSLSIAKSTARTHLLRIFAKTGCSRQAELVAVAARMSVSI